jgi:hypothetical protein
MFNGLESKANLNQMITNNSLAQGTPRFFLEQKKERRIVSGRIGKRMDEKIVSREEIIEKLNLFNI